MWALPCDATFATGEFGGGAISPHYKSCYFGYFPMYHFFAVYSILLYILFFKPFSFSSQNIIFIDVVVS